MKKKSFKVLSIINFIFCLLLFVASGLFLASSMNFISLPNSLDSIITASLCIGPVELGHLIESLDTSALFDIWPYALTIFSSLLMILSVCSLAKKEPSKKLEIVHFIFSLILLVFVALALIYIFPRIAGYDSAEEYIATAMHFVMIVGVVLQAVKISKAKTN